MRVAFAVVAVIATVCLAAAQAWADTPDGARQRLIAAKLSPNPLFPTYLPPAWEGARADLSHHGRLFEVGYTKCCDAQGYLTLIVGFGRDRYGALRDDLRFVRRVGHHYRALRIGSRRVYAVHDDINDGYEWHEQHLTYSLIAHGALAGTPSMHLLARIVASLAPLAAGG
jgi:hypothetical protein